MIGANRTVCEIPGEPDLIHLRREVAEGSRAITEMIGVPPHWYRGATTEYDTQAVTAIEKMGYGIAGFSVNADSGATLGKIAIEQRLKKTSKTTTSSLRI